MKTGDRVGAISSANDKEVKLYGYGIYEGDTASPLGHQNPKIKLDNGKTVWGYQCWWGSEEKVKGMIGNRKIIETDIDESE